MIFSGFLSEFKENLYAGDPVIRQWFLIKSDTAPLLICCVYILLVKVVIPRLMKDRKPFNLRKVMIVYNFAVVTTYVTCMGLGLYLLQFIDLSRICINSFLNQDNKAEYMLTTCIWAGYILKYIEFFDTIFFVLRKKDHLVSNLHVIHHTIVPLGAWVVLRSERSGFQGFPAFINTIVHIIMYTYYGLAAIGPSVQKYLWWKRYLTIFQMVQFVLIIFYTVVIWPLTGCASVKFSMYMNTAGAMLFFGLFYNFYVNTFLKKKQKPQPQCQANGHSK